MAFAWIGMILCTPAIWCSTFCGLLSQRILLLLPFQTAWFLPRRRLTVLNLQQSSQLCSKTLKLFEALFCCSYHPPHCVGVLYAHASSSCQIFNCFRIWNFFLRPWLIVLYYRLAFSHIWKKMVCVGRIVNVNRKEEGAMALYSQYLLNCHCIFFFPHRVHFSVNVIHQ